MRALIIAKSVIIFSMCLAFISSCDKINVPGNIAGQILNEAGQGQGYMSIHCIDAETGREADIQTAEDSGNFFFSKVEPGKYELKTFSMAGVEIPNDCEGVTLTAGRTLNVVITVYPEQAQK